MGSAANQELNMSAEVRQEQPSGPIAHLVSSRSVEEDRAWAGLYAAINQPSTAEEVVKHLDADQQSKRHHLALYIRAKTTLRERRLKVARAQRLAALIRMAVAVLVVAPVRLVAEEYVLIRDALLADLPAARWEPAAARARSLRSDPAFVSSNDHTRKAA
jgi:hypothetical protein